MSDDTTTTAPSTIKIGDEAHTIPPQTMAIMRDLAPIERELRRTQVRVDELDVQLANAQERMLRLATDDGEVGDEQTGPLGERVAGLLEARESIVLDQAELRIKMLAVRLRADADKLAETIDLRELDRLEEALFPPPPADRRTTPDS